MLVKALVLSDDSAIESVLSEIPFFCAGLVAFALSTFFLVMKRINLLSVYLYSSAIFAFGAAVLDLSQLLTRGANNIIQGTGTEAVRAIINTREVGFSISVGLRFLFFWKFVAERPRGEPPPLGPSLYTYNPWEQSHSASWKRWGYLGLFLKWSLLLATLALPILQILWRIVFRTIGPVYLVESTMQIVISALFMMKLLLNIFLSPVFPRSKAVASNLAPFLALGLNLGIGIGSLILFLFSETTLGRFLQAVELYFLMLFILISTFYNVPRRPPRADTTSYIVSPPEKSMQAPPAELSPTSVSVEDTSVQRRTSRRLSSWILAARRSSRAASGVRWLVTPDDVERDGSGNQQTKLTTEAHPEVKVQDEGIPWSGSLPSPLVTTPTRTQDGALAQLRGTDFSLSYYGATQPRDSGLSLDTHPPISKRDSRLGAESPVYGLNGIVNQSNARKSQTSFSSLDELLRQQNELDKSIANLRLFSTQATLGVPDSGRVVSSDSKPPRTESRTFSSTSNPSVFSLSVFPDPPKFSESERTFHTSRVSTLRTKRNTLSISQRDTLHNNGFVSRPQPGRLDSAGTSYDVTSFIGGLTKPITDPGHSHANSFDRSAPPLSDVESGDEGSPTTTVTRPKQLALRTEEVVSSSLPNDDVEESLSPVSPSVRLRPLLLANSTSLPSRPSPLTPRTMEVPAGPRKPIRRTPRNSQAKPFISPPRRELDHAFEPAAFEKPRPAPSIGPT